MLFRPQGCGQRRRCSPVDEAVLVEVAGGELPDGGVHAVLHLQQVHRAAGQLQALEQAALEQQVLAPLRQDRRRQLLGISHQHDPAEKLTQVKKEMSGHYRAETCALHKPLYSTGNCWGLPPSTNLQRS